MDPNRVRAGTVIITFGSLFLLIGLLGLTVELSEERSPGGLAFGAGFLIVGGAIVFGGLRLRRSAPSAKTIADLTASDFPDVDAQKFQSWKDAQAESQQLIGSATRRGFWILWPAIILVVFVRHPAAAVVFVLSFIGWIAYMLIHVRGLGNKARELQASASITPAMLTRALAGERIK